MAYLAITIILTLGVSALCSTLEVVVLSTSEIEIERLKKQSPRRGAILERCVRNIDETTSAILTANTIANTFGATLAGVQCAALFGSGIATAYVFPAALTVGILFFSEIMPKNIGIIYRRPLQPYLIYPLSWLRVAMAPMAKFTSFVLKGLKSKAQKDESGDDEIVMLANKGEKDGVITPQERDLIANSLSLDDVTIAEIMTPRTVVETADYDQSVGEFFAEHPNPNFSRFPVFRDTLDNIVGVVRRRDILTAMANDCNAKKISEIMQPTTFVPENGSALAVLRQLIKKHQQMGIVVDEFASLTGVITLEDIFEHLLGSEIFEADDIAVDMRELARHRSNKGGRKSPFKP